MDEHKEKFRIGAFAASGRHSGSSSSLKEKSHSATSQDPLMDLFSLDEEKQSPVEEVKQKVAKLNIKEDEGKEEKKRHPVFLLGADVEEERKETKEDMGKFAAFQHDIKTPFSTENESNSDLGVFFKDVQNAPHLNISPTAAPVQAANVSVEEDSLDINDQLASFEENLAEFDDMLKTLETSESESEQQ